MKKTQEDPVVLEAAEDSAPKRANLVQLKADAKVIARLLYNDPGWPFGNLKHGAPNKSGVYHYTSRLCDAIMFPLSRMQRVLKEWSKLGWYSYGVSPNTGWITNKGRDPITALARSA